jgi:hypothetical protein
LFLDSSEEAIVFEDDGSAQLLYRAARRLQRNYRNRKFISAIQLTMILNKKRKFALQEILGFWILILQIRFV